MAIAAISAINPAAFVPLVQSLARAAAAQRTQPAQTNAASNLQPAVTPQPAATPQSTVQLSIQQEILAALEQTLLGNLFSPFAQLGGTVVDPAIQSTLLTTFQLNTLFANGSTTDQGSASSSIGATPGLNLAAVFNSLNQISNTGTLLNTLA
jgi:hypothetical protein